MEGLTQGASVFTILDMERPLTVAPVATPVAVGVELEALRRQFVQVFGEGERVHIVRAPGRVNLIGEHTDYNDGFVFPIAIEPQVMLVCRVRQDSMVRLASSAFPNQIVEFSFANRIERGEPAWSNYGRGVAAQLMAAGIPLSGMEGLLVNTLPVGGGLSSSAAIEVAVALGLLKLAGHQIDPRRLALICQKAENEYAQVPCGIMDQTIVIGGEAGCAMLLDCRSMKKQQVKIDPRELSVVIVNSMVKHSLDAGPYRQRREQCEAGVKFFQKEQPAIRALRDVTLEQMAEAAAAEKLDPVILRRCRHVVTENTRTTQAATALEEQKYERAGELMLQSHYSLRDDFEVSVPELDFLVEQAMSGKGVYGARMTGGGFGGCIVALVQPRAVEKLVAHLKNAYKKKFDLDAAAFVTAAAAGAAVIE
jgi:galactokinase